MAQLNKETIKKLTELSRIGCTEIEQESLLHDLERILAYIEQLQEIDTENVPPCNHVLEGMVNVMREDSPGSSMSREEFLLNAPDRIAGLIRIPSVMRESTPKNKEKA